MSRIKDTYSTIASQVRPRHFILFIVKQLSPAYFIAVLVSILYVYMMRFVDHEQTWVPYLIVVTALAKSAYFTLFTFKQISRSIHLCHSFKELLSVFGLLVLLIIFSYSADFTCLSAAEPAAFRGVSETGSYITRLFEFFYFSVVTFASIGYGEIVPLSMAARVLTMFEIGQSFILVVFGLSNVRNIRNLISLEERTEAEESIDELNKNN